MDTEHMRKLVAARAQALAYYSPYFFLRQFPSKLQQELFGTGAALRWGQQAGAEEYTLPVKGTDVRWLVQQLLWDTTYFGTPMLRLFTGLFDEHTTSKDELARSAAALGKQLTKQHKAFYAFSIVPAEDIQLLQGLTAAGWRLVETRLTYFQNQVEAFNYPRFPVRGATDAEAAHIGQISASARNPYDRFHADAWFGQTQADAYLARYAENAVTTPLAATVLVPNEAGLPVNSFLAISDVESDAAALGTKLSRVLLTAVGPDNRGWHVKLVAETVHRAQTLGHEAVLMTTQATNHAVSRTAEKLNFKLGATSHVLAYSNL